MAVKAGTKRKTAPKEENDKRVRIDPEPSSSKPKASPAAKQPEAASSAPRKSNLKKTAEVAKLAPQETEELLHGFESSGEGSSDEDDQGSSDEEEASASTAVKAKDLPKVAEDSVVSDKLSSAKKSKKGTPGVVFIGRLPRGFEEDQLKQYFEQFGSVNRLRLSRNKKTGASKHYAFIEFAHEAVAEIVADTMNNYLLLGHILACHVVPEDNIHPKLWAGAGKRFKPMPQNRKEMHQHNAPKTLEQQTQIKNRLKKKDEAKRRKLQDAGIDYEFEGYKDSKPAAPKAVEASS